MKEQPIKEEITDAIYKAYGTDSGILFGIKEREIVLAIIEFTLNRVQTPEERLFTLKEALEIFDKGYLRGVDEAFEKEWGHKCKALNKQEYFNSLLSSEQNHEK